jgi:aminoglycoside 2''-phosphotransferase
MSDFDVQSEHLTDRIRAAFPQADLTNAMFNTDGLVNVAVIAEDRVYRFARTVEAQADLAKEIAILDLIRPHVSVPLPQFERVADDFVTYPFLVGSALFRNDILRLPEADQERLAEQLASFLKTLHGMPRETVEAKGIGASGGWQTQAQWLGLYEEIQRELFPLMYRSTQAWVHQHFAPLVDDPHWLDFEAVLIHDDLAQYHILYDGVARQIAGVIDFGTAGLGDAARDYGILINVYGESFVQRMARHDDRIARLIDRARFYGGVLELQWVLGGVRSKSFDWFTAHLDRARDVMPYGRGIG